MGRREGKRGMVGEEGVEWEGEEQEEGGALGEWTPHAD